MGGGGDRDLVFLTPNEADILGAVVDRLLPPYGDHPGAAALGAVTYVDRTLGAFSFDPPRVWAGGPFSGRHGGDSSFDTFTPLGALEELAWRTRIEGSRGDPTREWNGPVRGWQEIYRDGLGALGSDFAELDGAEQDARLDGADPTFRRLCFEHACEACYGAPEYGGNCDGRGWAAIRWPGDTQPQGWTDAQVSGRE